MMTGTPIIINRETKASKIISQNLCGLIVPYGDLPRLIEAIIMLKNNLKLRDKLGKNGRLAFKTKFDWNSLKYSFVKAYNQIV